MNNICLKNHADAIEYAQCITAISELIGEDCFCAATELYDAQNTMRILRFVTEGTKVTGFEIASC